MVGDVEVALDREVAAGGHVEDVMVGLVGAVTQLVPGEIRGSA